jgi:hypothetical protein
MLAAPRYVRSPSALSRTVRDVVLIAIPAREGFEKLSGTSSVAWDVLATPHTADELIDELAELYGADPAEVAPSVESLIEVFIGRALVSEVHDG